MAIKSAKGSGYCHPVTGFYVFHYDCWPAVSRAWTIKSLMKADLDTESSLARWSQKCSNSGGISRVMAERGCFGGIMLELRQCFAMLQSVRQYGNPHAPTKTDRRPARGDPRHLRPPTGRLVRVVSWRRWHRQDDNPSACVQEAKSSVDCLFDPNS